MTDDRDPQLVWTEAGEPHSGRYGDVYFSAEDGLAESRAVFLAGCGLPDAWAGRRVFTVGELGFGTGLNVVALLDLWQRTRSEGARLQVFSVEGFPLAAEAAGRALANWPEVADTAAALLARWPVRTPGFHRIDLPELHATLDLAVGDAAWGLDQWTGRADAWFLDGFAPATNPDMWSDTVLDGIAARSAPSARIATFTVAGAVRRGLSERGFAVEKKPGHGRKRERLEARRLAPEEADRPTPSVAVIGAGIAGAAMVRALRAAGVSPALFETDEPGAGASGFPAALVTPRFDLGDAAIAGLFAQALERAGDLYRATPGAVVASGVRQLPTTARDEGRFARIVDQELWREGSLSRAPDGGLDMADALTVAPRMVLDAWLDGAALETATVGRIAPSGGVWRVTASDGGLLAEVDAVVVCAGAGAADLVADLALTPVRGQAEWVEGPSPPAVAWGGYAAPTSNGFLFGATHDRGQTSTEVRSIDTARNLETLASRMPALAAEIEPAACRSRAAVRATTRDRLPLAGSVAGRPGLYVLGGLGSRGFCLAPLLAEHVAALLLGDPSPLPAAVASRIDPSRKTAVGLAQP